MRSSKRDAPRAFNFCAVLQCLHACAAQSASQCTGCIPKETYFASPCLATSDGKRLPISGTRSFHIEAFALAPIQRLPAELWHRRLMHISPAAVKRMQCHIPMSGEPPMPCHACLQGGSVKLPFGETSRRARPDASYRKQNKFTQFGQRISSDLCDMGEEGIDGERYAIIFHDSAEKYAAVYCIKDKTKETVLATFRQFLVEYQDQLPNGVGTFWTDNGSEYQNADMEQFCEEICVKRAWTIPYNSVQNPYAERAWGVALRKVRTSLLASNTPTKYWPYAIKHAVLIHNITVDKECSSPYERVHGEKYDYARLRVPFPLCYYLVPERERASKLSPKAVPARYLGPDPVRHGHMVDVPSLGYVTSGYHIVFNENRYYHDGLHQKLVHYDDDGNTSRGGTAAERRAHYREQRDNPDAADPVPHGTDADGENLPIHRRDPVPLRDDIVDADSGVSPTDDGRHGTLDHWSDNHCEDTQCLYPRGHSGAHSHEENTEDGAPRPYFRP